MDLQYYNFIVLKVLAELRFCRNRISRIKILTIMRISAIKVSLNLRISETKSAHETKNQLKFFFHNQYQSWNQRPSFNLHKLQLFLEFQKNIIITKKKEKEGYNYKDSQVCYTIRYYKYQKSLNLLKLKFMKHF